MLGILDQEQIERVLTTQIIGRIGCYSDGVSYVVPISYAYDGAFIYGHSQQGMKLNIMRDNPKICFQVDIIKNMANWDSVIVMGLFEELSRTDEKRTALRHLNSRVTPLISSTTVQLTPDWPFGYDNDLDKVKGILFRIRPQIKTGRFENSL
jgi:nitroimidazol reductase NimA-like FMN-containing flavoprotein (pyridoxamine 5'-phosphate oxidase superfamily)